MSTRFPHASFLALSVAACAVLIGCNQPADGPPAGEAASVSETDELDPHDVPITEEQKAELRSQAAQFADAVATIKQFRNDIERETAGGFPENPFKAHQALDKADLVLQWLPEIARDAGVAKAHWKVVNTSANDLRTLFEEVHQNIDKKQDPNFAAVSSSIDEKVAGLAAITATPEGAGGEQ